MNKKIYASLFRSFALIGAFAMLSLTTIGCVFTQSFGPNKTLIQNGQAQQIFTPCESGTLEYVSVYMQSTDFETFGAHLNIYKHQDNELILLHQQQLVVPSASQNPYSKVWLTHDVEVDISGVYSMEVIVPENRSAEFFMTKENTATGLFTANKLDVNGSLAFEYGINPIGWDSYERIMDENFTFDPEVDAYHGCIASQALYNDWAEYSAGGLTQTVEACILAESSVIYFNAQITEGSNMGLIFWVEDDHGNEIFSKLLSQNNLDYLKIEIPDTEFQLNEMYSLNFKILDGQVLNCATIDVPQYMLGTTTFNGNQLDVGACFIMTMNELEITDETGEEDEEEDDDDEVDEEGEVWWNPLHHRPVRKGESVFYKAYPNPFSTQFTLTFEDAPVGKATVAVYSFTGVKVYETEIEDLSIVKSLEVIPEGELSKGYYTIRIEQGETIILDTIIKH